MKKNIDVEIIGNNYTIRSDADEDYVHKIADYLNGKIQEVLQSTKTVDTLNVVILAALNIASEFILLRDEQGEFQRQVKERSRRLIRFIDDQVDNIDSFLD